MRAVGLLLLVTGCASGNTYRTATPLGRGATEVLVAPQVYAAGAPETAKAPFPELAIAVRHGVHPRLDVGGTVTLLPLGKYLNAFGLEATGKAHLWQRGRVGVAVGAGLGYRTVDASGAPFEIVQASMPLIVGIRLGRHELALSPTLTWQRWYSMGTVPVDIPAAGASIGFRWRIAERWALLPEIGAARSPVGFQAFEQSALLHVGIAVVRPLGN